MKNAAPPAQHSHAASLAVTSCAFPQARHISRWRFAVTLAAGSSGSIASTYGSFARLSQLAITGNFTTSLGSPVSDAYDAVGQLAAHNPGASSDTLTWDAFGRLVGLQRTGANGFSWNAVYDGFGRRLQTKSVASGTGTTVVAQSSYDPEVQFLELAVTVNNQREWLVHGPDLSGGYGDLQGTGGIDAVANPSACTATGKPLPAPGRILPDHVRASR